MEGRRSHEMIEKKKQRCYLLAGRLGRKEERLLLFSTDLVFKKKNHTGCT